MVHVVILIECFSTETEKNSKFWSAHLRIVLIREDDPREGEPENGELDHKYSEIKDAASETAVGLSH